jgi:prepilin-type processing-associated H-X9-DG protein
MNDLPKTNTQDQEQTDISSAKNKRPKKKVCILTKILYCCVIALILICALAIFASNSFEIDDDTVGFMVIAVFMSIIFIALPFLAIASLIRVSLNPDRLKGRVITTLVLAISCFLIFQIFVMMVPAAGRRGMSHRLVCATNLKGLGTALTVYAYDYDGFLPSDNWCDRLVEETDVSPKSFRCYRADSEEGESDYCLNKFAAGKKLSDLPEDMVLLFECVFEPAENEIRQPIKNRETFSDLEIMKDIFSGDEKVCLDRWNQVGGPELLDIFRHPNGCYVLYVDGHVEYIKLSELPGLQWNSTDDISIDPSLLDKPKFEVEKPPFLPHKTVLLTILGGLCVAVTLYILIKFKTVMYLSFIFGIAILSTGTGMLFGNMSEAAYISIGTTGRNAGGVFGLLVGICFAVLLANTPNRIKSLKTFKGFSTSIGMVTGIICSTLVHLALIIVNEETNFFGILIGIPYGVFAGAVLGFISGFLVKKFYSPKPPVNITVESD